MDDEIMRIHERMARISGIAHAFQESAILLAANETGIFAALSRGSLAAAGVAGACGVPIRGIEMMLDALCAMEILVKKEGTYSLSPEAAEFLVPGRPYFMGHSLSHAASIYSRFGNLAETVKSGEPAPREKEKRGRTPEEFRKFILAMADLGEISARLLLPFLKLKGDEKILDAGGGPGVYLQVICQAFPGARGVLFDLPETVEIAREYIAGKPGAERVEFAPGNFKEDDFPSGVDAVLVSNVIHMLGLQEIRAFFSKAWKALNPGGRLFVKDFILEPERTAPKGAAIFALNMFLGTAHGGCYTFEEIEDSMKTAGFEPVERVSITDRSSMVTGRKV